MVNDKKYNCVIIDDEPIAIRVIQDHLSKFEDFKCVQTFTKALDAIQLLNKEKIDLLFLDINMPGISGIEFLKTLAKPPKVIFTTAYRNFAVDAFDLDALDYLVKPISFERFLKAVNKFLSVSNPPEALSSEQKQEKYYIILKSDKKNYKIQFKDILYIESLDNYIKVHTSEFSIICYERLSAIEKELPASDFIRIHRSFIINYSKVDLFTSAFVEIAGRKFTIGRNYRDEVLNRFS
ncbi:MAG: LytTR family DNA-binding domain-containing protein [Bacteroidales bacterium]|jgi:DNA-binding LytR/AlgR family response regulator|nr:LytTR family DNA-binding domain-containing protein [Bacteroidales bacterium]